MKNWKIWTAFLTVFAAGIIAGAVGVGVIMKYHFMPPRNPAEFRQIMRQRLLDDIMENVHPDPAAIPDIKETLHQILNEVEEIRREMHPRIKGIFENGKERIKAHLTPDQAIKFDKMTEEQKKGRFGFLRLPPPPPPIP